MMSSNKAPGFAQHQIYQILISPQPDLIEVEYSGVIIAASQQCLQVTEDILPVVNYFPPQDVQHQYLKKSQHSSYCPFKGSAEYWDVVIDGDRLEHVVWVYPAPYDEVLALKSYMAFYQDMYSKLLVRTTGNG